jgi:hypothetical protein
MPLLWKIGMLVLIVCLLASIVIAIVRLATTPTETIGAGFRDLPAKQAAAYERASRQGSR